MRRALIVLCALAVLAPAQGASQTSLDRFLSGLETLRVDFTQRLTDAGGRELQRSTGRMVVVRPGRFRWEIRPTGSGDDAAQLLVSDGRNLWFYDRDLEQVTVKPAAAALTATPAMLLSGGPDWRAAFDVDAGGRSGGLDWVTVTPRRPEAEFREARLGFSGERLVRMQLIDRLGQTASLEFTHGVRNGRVAPDEVSFTPPPGVDVIGQPVS
ncbi:MAG: outer membrane lipoprotein chaperone LolA [Gammaproteobacteria bacterium]|nr:outer membrane lipoprotein chaperone LolA [Gammaproteobacteria bacterium]